MDAFIVIGNESTGKSSIVRSLTGIRNSDERLIKFSSGNIYKLWAKDSSLQEARITPQEFIQEAVQRNVDAVLLTLWPRQVTPRNPNQGPFPDAGGYIQEFITAQWNIQDIVTIDNPTLLNIPPNINTRNFNNNHAQPFNILVNTIRAYWSWV